MTALPLPSTVAILRFSSLGDIVLTSGAVETLSKAWPSARLLYVTKPAYRDLMAHHPAISEVVTFLPNESVWQLRQRLASLGVTHVLDLQGKLRGFFLRHLVSKKRRACWQQRPWYQSLSVRLGMGVYHAHMPIAWRYHQAVERLVGNPLPKSALRYYVSPEDKEKALELLAPLGSLDKRPLIGLCPGALWETKRWPYFSELAESLLRQGYALVLTGSSNERHLTQGIVERAQGALDVAGKVSLGVLAGVIAHCQVFVANDSGPMHVSRALAIPTVTFFGSTDPGQFDFSGHELLNTGLRCAPCSLHGLARCPQHHFRCMRDSTPELALAAVNRLLARNTPSPYVFA